MNELFSELKSHLVQIAEFTLDEKEELVMQESGVAGNEQVAFPVRIMPQRDKALSIFMVDSLVDQEVLADDDDSTGAVVTWDLDQEVGRVVNGENVLADDVVKSKVHLIEG